MVEKRSIMILVFAAILFCQFPDINTKKYLIETEGRRPVDLWHVDFCKGRQNGTPCNMRCRALDCGASGGANCRQGICERGKIWK